MSGARAVRWGPAVVARLIPQRRPFLLLDRVTAWGLEPAPSLEGCRHVSANDPVFEGHFPGNPIWPGVLTIEGMAQASSALMATLDLVERLGVDAVALALEHVELGATLQPGYDPERVEVLRSPSSRAPGLFGAADIKLLAPVFPGCRLDYRVRLARRVGDLARFEVAATVDGRTVAQGALSGTG